MTVIAAIWLFGFFACIGEELVRGEPANALYDAMYVVLACFWPVAALAWAVAWLSDVVASLEMNND